ncbi:hypothetical protein [Ktedonospora formicarum]|uniref:Uncharacterized protein n=1 Tax=Ktedonospora formicarum TaxID=2778364 RepID=A0A8J3I2A6_9CHLR|nr:hypothetical protein [Ktedonospora formicarum]GHO43599.1 hypothetical protein KSX_17620 [Ktedonospora formicarum]
MKLALKITPQRSTQYMHMADALALPELLTSPLRKNIVSAEIIHLAGQGYVLAEFSEETALTPDSLNILGRLGATSEIYVYYERIGEVEGPLLHPLASPFTPFLPYEIAEARRYKGKTNELFTRVLLNVAIFAGAYAEKYNERLRVLDPLAGGGTTLFLALAAGYDAFGIEMQRQDVETTAGYIRQYLTGEGFPFKEVDERGRKAGRRYQFEIGRKGQKITRSSLEDIRSLVLAHGNTIEATSHMREIQGGPHMHAIVGDLPYGIQHFGELSNLLRQALPVWERMLLPGGTLALAWNATRVERAALIDVIQTNTRLRILNESPYSQFTHAVDRVIKKRDILVAVAE